MMELLGEERARAILSQKGHYAWIYERVLEDTDEIGAILAKHGLLIAPEAGLVARPQDTARIQVRLKKETARLQKRARTPCGFLPLRVLSRYDVRPWLFTREVVIQRGGIPHSKPVLTPTTEMEYFENDDRQLASSLHGQIPWFENAHLAVINRVQSADREAALSSA